MNTDKHSIDEGLGDLLLYSLAKRTGVSREIISFHPLVLEVSRRSITSAEQQEYTKLALILLGTAVAYSGGKHTCDWIFEQGISAVMDTGIENMRRYLQNELWDLKIATAVCWIADFYISRGVLDTAKELCARTIQYYGTSNFEGLDCEPHRTDAFTTMGLIYSAQENHLEALKCFEVALPSREKALGKEDCGTHNIVFLMARSYNALKNYNKASEFYNRVLASTGEDGTPYYQCVADDMAGVIADEDEPDKTLEWYERALCGFESRLGDMNLNASNSTLGIATLQGNQIKFNRAIEWYELGLARCKKVLGKGHPITFDTVNQMVDILMIHGKSDKAFEVLERALAVCEMALGKEHPATLQTMFMMATILVDQGNYYTAIKLLDRVGPSLERVLGERHQGTLLALTTKAGVLRRQGKHGKALELLQQTRPMCERALGDNHRTTLITISEIAACFVCSGNYDEALELYWRVLARYEEKLRKEDPATIDIVGRMAVIFRKQRKFGAAFEWFQRQLMTTEEFFGAKHRETIVVLDNIAYTFSLHGEYANAGECYQIALARCKQALRKEDPTTTQTAD